MHSICPNALNHSSVPEQPGSLTHALPLYILITDSMQSRSRRSRCRTAHQVLFHDSHFGAYARRTSSGHKPSGSSANDHQIVPVSFCQAAVCQSVRKESPPEPAGPAAASHRVEQKVVAGRCAPWKVTGRRQGVLASHTTHLFVLSAGCFQPSGCTLSNSLILFSSLSGATSGS